jgi:hypothetical protein
MMFLKERNHASKHYIDKEKLQILSYVTFGNITFVLFFGMLRRVWKYQRGNQKL